MVFCCLKLDDINLAEGNSVKSRRELILHAGNCGQWWRISEICRSIQPHPYFSFSPSQPLFLHKWPSNVNRIQINSTEEEEKRAEAFMHTSKKLNSRQSQLVSSQKLAEELHKSRWQNFATKVQRVLVLPFWKKDSQTFVHLQVESTWRRWKVINSDIWIFISISERSLMFCHSTLCYQVSGHAAHPTSHCYLDVE